MSAGRALTQAFELAYLLGRLTGWATQPNQSRLPPARFRPRPALPGLSRAPYRSSEIWRNAAGAVRRWTRAGVGRVGSAEPLSGWQRWQADRCELRRGVRGRSRP